MNYRVSLLLVSLVLPTIWGRASVVPNALISDGMVLEQKSSVKIWGTANANQKITVAFRDQSVSAVSDAAGNWILALQSKEAGGPFPMTIEGENKISLANVYVGEVWVLSGQSNMELPLARVTGGPEASAAATNTLLRIFQIPHVAADEPQGNVKAAWIGSDPRSTKNFSAVGYWFGSKLQKELGVPVGLILSCWGGTTIEAWLSSDVLDNLAVKDQWTDYATAITKHDAEMEKEKPLKDKYEADVAAAKENHLPPPPVMRPAIPPRGPSMLYNGMIAPLENETIKGVVWYQGENNGYLGVKRASTYSDLLPKLIDFWRAKWGEGDFPFIVVQLAPFGKKPATDPNAPSGLAVVREAQRQALKLPNTALVVTMDLADPDFNVHYKRKQPVGERAEQAAMALAYAGTAEGSGPLFQTALFDGGKAVISFTHLGGGLVAQGGDPAGFTLAGADKKFFAADAVIVGNQVTVSSASVPQPVSVRYGWADIPVPSLNLFNKAGLPASPFRSDDWAFDTTIPVRAAEAPTATP
jgi:sialate O-acetylesterase